MPSFFNVPAPFKLTQDAVMANLPASITNPPTVSEIAAQAAALVPVPSVPSAAALAQQAAALVPAYVQTLPAKHFVLTTTADVTLDGTKDVILVNATTTSITVTLPAVSSFAGLALTVKVVGLGALKTVTVKGAGATLLDSANTLVMSLLNSSTTWVSDGSVWRKIAAV